MLLIPQPTHTTEFTGHLIISIKLALQAVRAGIIRCGHYDLY